ncbi:MAG: HAMP domain-containing protein [Anaerolineales bacterium]|nr:MAG: HAMP domain-containing protein [Anaerolineales bacterium]
MLKSIRTRLVLSHLFVIFVAMAISGFLLLSFLERYFVDAMERSLLAQAHLTAQALIPGATARVEESQDLAAANVLGQQQLSNISVQMAQQAAPPSSPPSTAPTPRPDSPLASLSDVTLSLSAELQTRIRILDQQGVVLVDSMDEDVGRDLSGIEEVAQALSGRPGKAIRLAESRIGIGGRTMYVAVSISVDRQVVGAVYLSQSMSDLLAVIYDLRWRLVISTTVAAVMASTAGLLLSRALTRPIRQLTLAADEVARGDLERQVPVRSADEIGRLGQAFNRMIAQLRATERMRTDFVSNVSHELRTPLTAIKGLVETLRDGAVDDRKVRDRFLATIEDETDRLIRLVNDLLVLSKADSQALKLKRESLDVQDLVERSVRKLAPQLEEKGILVEVTVSAGPPLVLADADRIEQVLVNLLDNAIKYSPEGGRITVAIDDGGPVPEMVSVAVRDEGLGIPAGDLPRVFERFYRVDRARSRDGGGSGLGLSIAKAIVEAHGGEITLRSEEGQGTTVRFTLPRA